MNNKHLTKNMMAAKLLIMGCLVLLSNGVESAWLKIGEDKLRLYYIESETIIPYLEGRRMAKELHEYKITKSDGTTSLRIRSDYDCKKRMVRNLAVDKVAGEMGVGKIIQLITEASRWKSVPLGSGRAAVMQYVCNYRVR